jgi:GNAT superfamily N-acetyltransferase
MMDLDTLHAAADACGLEVVREYARHAPGGVIDERGGVLCTTSAVTAANFTHVAARTDSRVTVEDALKQFDDFFHARREGSLLMPRLRGDEDLVSAAVSRGGFTLRQPAMAMTRPPAGDDPPALVLREVEDAQMLAAWAGVVVQSYQQLAAGGPEIPDAYFADPTLLTDVRSSFVIAELQDRAVGSAAVFVSHRAAWITWVGAVPEFRGRGVGEATTRWATQRGFDLGAQAAWLTASALGEPVYRRMGFEQFADFTPAWLPPAPADG